MHQSFLSGVHTLVLEHKGETGPHSVLPPSGMLGDATSARALLLPLGKQRSHLVTLPAGSPVAVDGVGLVPPNSTGMAPSPALALSELWGLPLVRGNPIKIGGETPSGC